MASFVDDRRMEVVLAWVGFDGGNTCLAVAAVVDRGSRPSLIVDDNGASSRRSTAVVVVEDVFQTFDQLGTVRSYV